MTPEIAMFNGFFALVGFVINLIFFIWFGATLTSINRSLKTIATHSESQTRMQASMANAAAERRQ